MVDAVIFPTITAGAMLTVAMAFAWYVQRRTGNSGWIDTIWTFATGAAAIVAIFLGPGEPARRAMVALLVGCWSVRLGLHILARTRRTDDDPRYANLLSEWGEQASIRMFGFLQLQAVAALVLTVAALLAASGATPVTSPIFLLACLVAAGSIVGEGLADAQLTACKRSRPANGICETGLWARSRHPNYLFEWLFWVAIAIMAALPPFRPAALLAALAPCMMYYLLRYASGVPHLEAHMARTRPEAFADYARRVPAFFPRLW